MHFDTETSKSFKCDLETFRFLDVQTSETNLHFKTLKKYLKSARQLRGKKYNNNNNNNKKQTNSRLVTHITVKNQLCKFVKPYDNFGETHGF